MSIAALLLPKSEKKDTECGRLLRDAFEILFSHVCVIYLVSQKTRLEAYSILYHMGFHMHPIQLSTNRVGRLGLRSSSSWGLKSFGGFACLYDGLRTAGSSGVSVLGKEDAGENTVLGAPQRRHRSWGGRGLGGSE